MTFKAGDKVRRKADYMKGLWLVCTGNSERVFTVSWVCVDNCNLSLVEIESQTFSPSRFERAEVLSLNEEDYL